MAQTAASIGDRLAAAAKACFVGRRAEIALFDRMATAAFPPFALLWFVGPGGVGKSTLLSNLRERAITAGRRVVFVDAAAIDPVPDAFARKAAPEPGSTQAEPPVLFIDTCERLSPLNPWLRDTFLPSLPANSLIVCAGRTGPDEAWRDDPRWATLVRECHLGELDEAESRALLVAHGVPAEHHAAALVHAHGYPLALSLIADLLRQSGGALASITQGGSAVVQGLVERFLRDVPDARHRRALRLAGFVRHTTEPLLAAVLGGDDARALLGWMRRLGFMQAAEAGLVPHELVREIVVADALWSDPDESATLTRMACAHFYDGIVHSAGRRRLHFQAEVLYVLRHQPHKARFFDWTALDQHRVEPARSEDERLVSDMVLRHEGAAALPWLRHWWTRQRDGFRLFRSNTGRCDGFMLMLRIGADASAADRSDPAVEAVWSFVGERRPLVRDQELVLLRHWMHADCYQAVSAAINLTAMHVVTYLITHPRAVWSAVYMADPDFWRPHFDGVNFARCPRADYVVGGRRFGAFVHDWLFEPAPTWLAGEYRPMPEREGADAHADGTGLVIAVREALRVYTDPAALGRTSLARRLGVSGGQLRDLLGEALAQLRLHPRDRKFERALWFTYFEPRLKQEQAAAELGIPFPTYRYRLQQAVARLAECLEHRVG